MKAPMNTPPPATGVRRARLERVTAGDGALASDWLAVEEPLEIRVGDQPPLVTLRTPGEDAELVRGLLLGEGVIDRADDIARIDLEPGRARVLLRAAVRGRAERLLRGTLRTSACGYCGSLQPLRDLPPPLARIRDEPVIDAALLPALPGRLRAAQPAFLSSGGLHAAALFDGDGALLAVREDVGRHNALDKLLGWALGEQRLPLHDHLLLLSGRAGFELVQKALRAAVPVLCAVSAPSTLAVEAAQRHGMTLVGFLREGRYNLYAGGRHLG